MRPIRLRQYLQRFGNLIHEKPSLPLAKSPFTFDYIHQALANKIKVKANLIQITTALEPSSFDHSLGIDDIKWLTLDLLKLLLELIELGRRMKGQLLADYHLLPPAVY